MASRLKLVVCAALPLAGFLVAAPQVVLARSHDHPCREEGDYRRSYDDEDRYDEEAPAERSRYGRRAADDDPYDDDGPYDDPSLYPMPETRGPYPDPTSLEPSALLPAFLGVLLSGQ